MEERRQGWIRQRRDLLIMAALLLAFMAFSVIKIGTLASDNSDTIAKVERLTKRVAQSQAKLTTGLIRSCQHSPIRKAVIGGIKEEIAQSRAADLELFFPQIPPDQLHDAVHEAQRQRHQRLHEIKSVDCRARYR